jgi:hypothetical protein
MSKVLPTLAVLLLALGWMGLSGNESRAPALGVSNAQAETTGSYYPAGFVLQPNESEPEVYEYY